jgi:hypothetical protein
MATTVSAERKRRIEGILATTTPPPLKLPLSGETLRGVRAVEVLERLATPKARELLRSWAEQIDDLHLAVEAAAALARVGATPGPGNPPVK